uniref:Uncharacterized protein n=1 Tax=Oryza sativa subsp. japonica TaxID=39947 RepID=Q6Z544_ORYSJ|nr:hypothetical protein [Oryza sativa Japonica Group]
MDKVNDITTSRDDDKTRDPQTSRGPEDEISFKWSRYYYGWFSTSNVAILVLRLLMVELRLRLVFHQQRSDPRTTTFNGRVTTNWSSTSSVAILVLRLLMVELRLIGLPPAA